MLRVGLTGGIATGKSRVRGVFAGAGLVTIDLDQIAHMVVEPDRPAHEEIVRAFGPAVVAADGHIDRKALAAIVFSDASARERLNAIVHPRVFEEEERVLRGLAPGPKDVVVTDATLLVESGYHIRFDRLVVTHCDRRQQLGRLMARDGLSAGAAQARIASQMDGAEKARFAHHVIDTTGDTATTDAAALALAEQLKTLAASWRAAGPVPVPRALGCLLRGPQRGPRGVSPLTLLSRTAEAGAPPLAVLARDLVPPHQGPWYEAGLQGPAGPGSETWMGPLVLWSRAWHGGDVSALVAAAVSLARLAHATPEALGAAAVVAVALSEVASEETMPRDLYARVRAHVPSIERWTGAPPPFGVLRLIELATRTGSAGADELETLDPNGLLGALRGLAEGTDAGGAPPELRDAVDRIARLSSQR